MKDTDINPFYPNDPVPPNQFFGREKEVTQIVRAMEQTIRGRSESVLIVGPRGSGKTSLVGYAAEDARGFSRRLGGDEENVLPILVSCGGVTSLHQFCKRVLRSIYKATRAFSDRLRNGLKKVLEGMGIQIGPLTVSLSFEEDDLVEGFTEVLHEVWEKKVFADFGALQLLIDETDEMAGIPEFPGFIKTTIEDLSRASANIHFVMTATDSALKQMVSHHGSLPRIFHMVSLLPFSESEVETVVQKTLSNTRKSATSTFVRTLAVFTAGIPNYVQQFCYCAYEVDRDGRLDLNDLIAGAMGSSSGQGAFEMLWLKHFQRRYDQDIRSDYVRKILHTISLFDNPVLSRDIRETYVDIFAEEPTANLSVYLTNLVSSRMLVRYGSKSPYTYAFADPGFQVLLRFHPDTNAGIVHRIHDYMLRDRFAQASDVELGEEAEGEA